LPLKDSAGRFESASGTYLKVENNWQMIGVGHLGNFQFFWLDSFVMKNKVQLPMGAF